MGARLCAVEPAEVIARRGGEAELVADEVVKHGAGIATNGAMRFVGDDEIEIRRGEELLVLVVEEQGLHGGDDSLRASPVVPVFLVDHGLVVGGKDRGEGLPGLVLQFKAIHQEEDAADIPGTQKELDDSGGGQGLAGAGGHLEQEVVMPFADRGL